MIVVPVVDNDERLIGAVPQEALFRILRDEHMEDIQNVRYGGTRTITLGECCGRPLGTGARLHRSA